MRSAQRASAGEGKGLVLSHHSDCVDARTRALARSSITAWLQAIELACDMHPALFLLAFHRHDHGWLRGWLGETTLATLSDDSAISYHQTSRDLLLEGWILSKGHGMLYKHYLRFFLAP